MPARIAARQGGGDGPGLDGGEAILAEAIVDVVVGLGKGWGLAAAGLKGWCCSSGRWLERRLVCLFFFIGSPEATERAHAPLLSNAVEPSSFSDSLTCRLRSTPSSSSSYDG